MRNEAAVKNVSPTFGNIQTAHMTEHQRQRTLDAMRQADLFSDGLLWTIHKIEDLTDHLFGKSVVKH